MRWIDGQVDKCFTCSLWSADSDFSHIAIRNRSWHIYCFAIRRAVIRNTADISVPIDVEIIWWNQDAGTTAKSNRVGGLYVGTGWFRNKYSIDTCKQLT